jgi:hypothetical protein
VSGCALRRPFSRAGPPVTLHAPGGHLQQPLDRTRRARHHLRLEGLPRQGTHALQGDEARSRRVHAPLPAARAARRLPPHPAPRANGSRKASLAAARELLIATPPAYPTGHTGDETTGASHTQLRLPAPRRRDDHRADLHARADHPRTARHHDEHPTPPLKPASEPPTPGARPAPFVHPHRRAPMGGMRSPRRRVRQHTTVCAALLPARAQAPSQPAPQRLATIQIAMAP